MKKVLFIVPYPPEGASNRFRVQQFLPALAREGIAGRVRPFYNRPLWRVLYRKGCYLRKLFWGLVCAANRLLDLFRSFAYDMVFIHREGFPVGPAWFERLLTLTGRTYVYDFDDAIYLPNVAHPNRFFGRLKCPGKVAGIVRRSRLTIAGNTHLAEFARAAGAGRVVVMPTVVDTERFRPAEKDRAGGKIVIGWIGSPTTIEFLENFRGVMENFAAAKQGRVTFRIVGGRLAGPSPDYFECVPWTLETELEELHRFDIGIMPMPDNEWTRGKCAFKAIEYMAVGIPAVCSPVGMNVELIEHGVNGFLAENADTWTEILSNLAADPGLRKQIGLAGRKTVEERYSLAATLPKFKSTLLEALD